jgi:hypothetical protein
MKDRKTKSSGAVALLLCALPLAHRQDPVPARDPALQDTIRKALHAADEQQLADSLASLRRIGGADPSALVLQLFLFSKDATDTREAMAFGGLADLLRIPAQDIVAALVPLLESSDPALRRSVGDVLSEFEHRSAERGADFSVYRPLLESRIASGAGVPPGLVRHMYAIDPGAAFLLLLRVQVKDVEEQRPLLWAEHAVADVVWKQRFGFLAPDVVEPAAAEELRMLARHPHWWARLYAAQISSRHRGFRDPALVEELRRDPHPLVQDVARAIEPPR